MRLGKSLLSNGHVASKNTSVRLSGQTLRFGIHVNFSELHDNYYSAYRYVCKNDPNFYKSANHPDLQEIGSPVTKKCMSAYRQKCRTRKIDDSTEITANQANESNNIDDEKMRRL